MKMRLELVVSSSVSRTTCGCNRRRAYGEHVMSVTLTRHVLVQGSLREACPSLVVESYICQQFSNEQLSICTSPWDAHAEAEALKAKWLPLFSFTVILAFAAAQAHASMGAQALNTGCSTP